MSIMRSVDATMKNFWCDIDGNPVLLDHIKQLNLYLSVGNVGEYGDITITYDMYKMLSVESQKFCPVGKTIEFEIEDDKTGTRNFTGIITSFRKIHNVKQDLVLITFEREKILKLKHAVWWKCFKEKTTLEIFEEFLNEYDLELNKYPEDHAKMRSTFWEAFATPMNIPTLDYLMSELAKDHLVVFANPETQGVTVASWHDMNKLDILMQNHPDYVVDGILAKFDQSKDQWKETTFVNAKQIDTRAPWKIMEWSNIVAPNIHQDSLHINAYYSGLKKELFMDVDEATLKENDLGLTQAFEYSGRELIQSMISPYPTTEALRNNGDTPHVDTSGYNDVTNQSIHPRYFYHRMRESYDKNIRWISSKMLIAGSCKAVVPLSTIQVTYFENAMNRNKHEFARGDIWQSGLYLITSSQISISGNNILCSYELLKPYQ